MTTMSIATQSRDVATEVDARLTALLDRLVRRGIHHANLAVMSGDGRRWAGAAGPADAEGQALNPDTPFFIASVTKRFIATLVLQAHERGELRLDDPITAHLPPELTDGLHVHRDVDHTPAITVHHLLTHTSGLPDYFDKPRSGPSLYQQLAAGDDRSWTLADVVRWVREEHRPHFPPQDLSAPKQKARYSDTGFQLLIAIVEQATGHAFADLLHDRIFEPVGMVHSWLPGRSKPLADTPEPARIHDGRRPLELLQLIESSNDLVSTADDLLRFEQALLSAWLKRQGHSEKTISKVLLDLGKAAALGGSKTLYDANREVYGLLRYGVKIKPDVGEQHTTVWLVDWQTPANNDFAIAEEVTVPGENTKRPDVVLYVNGIALGVLELKRSIVSVAEGIRQNLDSQKKIFIEHFFSTMQLVMAGNDTEGLRYGAIQTPEKYYLTWKEASAVENRLDRALIQLCGKTRFLELIHDFIVFDAGTKKLCRAHQYFGVHAAQAHVGRREGGIIWHTQGSGKSLVMVWLTKWIREHVKNARVLIVTDRTELDEQIERVFKGVNEDIYRTKSGADLVATLNATRPWLLCSLVHKFGGKEEGEEVGDIPAYVEELRTALPRGFKAKGDLFVYVDECHRTQSGELHKAMKAILPGATFIGFTGTPLLKADKRKSIEVFGRYIHTYKFDEAVKDKVVLDLRYEARDVDQRITSQSKIDQWFESKTRGLTNLAKAQLKRRWGTMQKVLSCQNRLEKIVADILMDMETRDRLKSGHGNAMLIAGSIYEACKFFELFDKTDLHGKCAIVTSYAPQTADLKGVSYKGAAEAITNLLGGHIDLTATSAGSVVPHVEAGRLKIIAVAAPRRLGGALADVPTWKEQGVNVEFGLWRLAIAPKGLSDAQTAWWQDTLRKATVSPEWKTVMEQNFWSDNFVPGTEFRKTLPAEYATVKALFTDLGLAKQ